MQVNLYKKTIKCEEVFLCFAQIVEQKSWKNRNFARNVAHTYSIIT
jgi:hypothetical protein